MEKGTNCKLSVAVINSHCVSYRGTALTSGLSVRQHGEKKSLSFNTKQKFFRRSEREFLFVRHVSENLSALGKVHTACSVFLDVRFSH